MYLTNNSDLDPRLKNCVHFTRYSLSVVYATFMIMFLYHVGDYDTLLSHRDAEFRRAALVITYGSVVISGIAAIIYFVNMIKHIVLNMN